MRWLIGHGRRIAGSALHSKDTTHEPDFSRYFCPYLGRPSPFGKVLIADNQLTLYTFTKDTPTVSNFDTKCAEHWPPLSPDETDAPFERFIVIERADESYQWAVDGKPLYFYWEDQKSGETLGEGHHGTSAVARS